MKPWSRWQDWVSVVAGLWLFVSSWIIATTPLGAEVTRVLGGLVFLVALWALAGPSSQIPVWFNVVLGIVAIISPWVVGFAFLANPTWSSVCAGVVVLALSAWAISELRRRPEVRMA